MLVCSIGECWGSGGGNGIGLKKREFWVRVNELRASNSPTLTHGAGRMGGTIGDRAV